jgi:hypothetical protein
MGTQLCFGPERRTRVATRAFAAKGFDDVGTHLFQVLVGGMFRFQMAALTFFLCM